MMVVLAVIFWMATRNDWVAHESYMAGTKWHIIGLIMWSTWAFGTCYLPIPYICICTCTMFCFLHDIFAYTVNIITIYRQIRKLVVGGPIRPQRWCTNVLHSKVSLFIQHEIEKQPLCHYWLKMKCNKHAFLFTNMDTSTNLFLFQPYTNITVDLCV